MVTFIINVYCCPKFSDIFCKKNISLRNYYYKTFAFGFLKQLLHITHNILTITILDLENSVYNFNFGIKNKNIILSVSM